jgi:quinol monooxygenase YgiN
MIQVVVEIIAKAGQRDAVLTAFKANVPAVHAEQGCIEYSAFVDAAGFGALAPYGDDTFIVIEKWESAFCNGPSFVNPSISLTRCPVAGFVLLYGVGAQAAA